MNRNVIISSNLDCIKTLINQFHKDEVEVFPDTGKKPNLLLILPEKELDQETTLVKPLLEILTCSNKNLIILTGKVDFFMQRTEGLITNLNPIKSLKNFPLLVLKSIHFFGVITFGTHWRTTFFQKENLKVRKK